MNNQIKLCGKISSTIQYKSRGWGGVQAIGLFALNPTNMQLIFDGIQESCNTSCQMHRFPLLQKSKKLKPWGWVNPITSGKVRLGLMGIWGEGGWWVFNMANTDK